MIRGPTDQNRTVVLGRTGSGKSQFSIALLSTRNFDEMPWIIIDYKGEDLIQDIVKACKGGVKEISVHSAPPKNPGLYYLRVTPMLDDDAMNAFLWKVHKQGYCGLFVDEGFALPQKFGNPFDILLTQGRSLHIPIICLYQRPVYMSRFAVAQADFFAVFEQNDERDLKTTAQFVKPVKKGNGQVITVFNDLPPYHCLWYDVSQGVSAVLKPAPSRTEIINAFVSRLNPTKKKVLI